jgi:hypothetical protein
MPANGGWPDRALGHRVTMFFSSSIDGRYCMATVLAHEVKHFGAMKRPSLAVRVRMPATTHTEMHESKEDVHGSPICSRARSQSCNLPDCPQRVNGQNARNILAVPFNHSSLSWCRLGSKVIQNDPKSLSVFRY